MLTATAEFIADLAPAYTNTSNVKWFAELNGTTYFVAAPVDDYGQNSLWVTDGTPEGTNVVAQIPGAVMPLNTAYFDQVFANFDGRLFFVVSSDEGDRTLWSTDGTAAGTAQFSDLSLAGFGTNGLLVAGDKLYFGADDASTGQELWATDGTVEGTQMVADIGPGSTGSVPEPLFTVGNQLYFTAATPTYGRELWVTDGTTTTMLRDFVPGVAGGSVDITGVDLDGTAIFTEMGGGVLKLWRSDGTPGGTVLVQAPTSELASRPILGEVLDGRVYFTTQIQDRNSFRPHELWVTDGTDFGTYRVKTFPTQSDSVSVSEYASIGDQLYFLLNRQLWTSDGTENGTFVVKDVPPDTTYAGFSNLAELGGKLYFVNGVTLWTSDGTGAGTQPVTTVAQYAPLTVSSGKLFFQAGNTEGGLFPVASDGTAAGTVDLGVVNINAADGNPSKFVDVNGTLYFVANTDFNWNHNALWKTDGTLEGTKLVFSTPMTPIAGLQNIDGQLTFITGDASGLSQFWTTDGTWDGTHAIMSSYEQYLILDLNPPTGEGRYELPKLFLVGEDRLYFSQAVAGSGTQTPTLWKLDDSPGGASRVKSFENSSDPYAFTVLNDRLYFLLQDDVHGPGLWVSDGTVAGTHFITTTYDNRLVNAGGALYFAYPEYPQGIIDERFRYDPATESITELTLPGFVSPKELNGIIYFGNGNELWKSDGTAEGTELVTTIPGTHSEGIVRLEKAGGSLYFVTRTESLTSELWISDGTAEGTRLVQEFPGILNDDIYEAYSQTPFFQDVDGRLAFMAAVDDSYQMHAVITDGTPQGTHVLDGVMLEASAVNYMGLGTAQSALYFSAKEPGRGAELFRLPSSTPGDANYDGLVNATDYTTWSDHFLRPGEWGFAQGDFNRDGVVDGADYVVWADNFAPGPAAAAPAAAEDASVSASETATIAAMSAAAPHEQASSAAADGAKQPAGQLDLQVLRWAAAVDRHFAQAVSEAGSSWEPGLQTSWLDRLRSRRGSQ